MKANEAPEKIYIPRLISNGMIMHEWNDVPFKKYRFFYEEKAENIEYVRTDAFIEKACEWLNKESESYVKTSGVGACVTYEGLDVKELVEDFRNYIKGE